MVLHVGHILCVFIPCSIIIFLVAGVRVELTLIAAYETVPAPLLAAPRRCWIFIVSFSF